MGFIPQDQINRLKDSLDIVDVVSSYVDLKQAGSNMKGLCPFHNEKTPSFIVNSQRNSFHCFGCHEGGDPISFIMKIENLDYINAIRFLADKMGITLDEEEYKNDNREKKNSLYKINSDATKFYFKQMLTENLPQEYVQKRGLGIDMVNTFFLGYAPYGDKLYNFLLERGHSIEDMLSLGLIKENKKEGGYYDYFGGRLIFPIINNKSKVIGLGGRTLFDAKAKYLNSPDSLVFHKGENIYGISQIQRNKNRDRIILVEGYMDVIGLHNQGVTNAVASLGTALTENQARLINRYANEVFIAYDSDNAGIKASLRAIEVFNKIGVDPKIISFPQGMDPDEFVLKFGKEEFDRLLKNADKSLDYRMSLIIDQNRDRIELTKDLIDFLSDIEGNALREIYTKKVANSIGISYDSLIGDVMILHEKKEEKKSRQKQNSNSSNFYSGKKNQSGYNRTTKNQPVITRNYSTVERFKNTLDLQFIALAMLSKNNYEKLEQKARSFINLDIYISMLDKLGLEYKNIEAGSIKNLLDFDEFKNKDIRGAFMNLYSTYTEDKSRDLVREHLNRVDNFQSKLRISEIDELLKDKNIGLDEKYKLVEEKRNIANKLQRGEILWPDPI